MRKIVHMRVFKYQYCTPVFNIQIIGTKLSKEYQHTKSWTSGNIELSQSHLATHLFNWISILTSFWVHTTPKSWLLYFRKTTQLYMLYNAPQGFNPRSLADLWYLMMNKPAIPWRPTSGNTFLPPEQLLGITALQSNVYKTVKRCQSTRWLISYH